MNYKAWTQLEKLPKGALFETENNIRAVKSDSRNKNNHQPMCVLLGTGEMVYFEQQGATRVREIILI